MTRPALAAAPPLPTAAGASGWHILQALLRQRSMMAALAAAHEELGDAFRLTLPGFSPAVLVGPAHNRLVLVSERRRFDWRTPSDPVTRLLRRGILVQDGAAHQRLRQAMEPALGRQPVLADLPAMLAYTDSVIDTWQEGEIRDMLVEMRRLALLILMGLLFRVNFAPDMDRLWSPILKTLKFISPGLWLVWPDMPRAGYRAALAQMDRYLYRIIRQRREDPTGGADLLSHLIQIGLDDGLIRDQLLTMLIAGHDTSTALLAWALYLLGRHPDSWRRAQAEVDRVCGREGPDAAQLGRLPFLDQVIKETLRLYPPIHVGNRLLNEDLDVAGYRVNAGARVMYSIYLAHRDRRYWAEPDAFRPARFDRQESRGRPALTYVPFGGGPRNCIGAIFAQLEARAVLARILQRCDLDLMSEKVRLHMGATLEPRPGVRMRVRQRRYRPAESR